MSEDRFFPGGGDPAPLTALVRLLRGRGVVALTGAGCSTESGIPDYRGPDGRFRARAPVRYREFVSDPDARRRYWARSAVGWPRFSAARPNRAHRALARLEERGAVRGVITQNVDGLHQEAGSRRVVELHGSLSRVRCLDCGTTVERAAVQERLLALNPGWVERWAPAPGGNGGGRTRGDDAGGGAPGQPGAEAGRLAPDGDAELPAGAVRTFRVPTCTACAGVLKPDVVFFGENVPAARVERAWELYGRAEVLLVAGSSLAVYSGRRFVHRAGKEGVPVAVVNLGPTRADDRAEVRVAGRLGSVMPLVAAALGRPGAGTIPAGPG